MIFHSDVPKFLPAERFGEFFVMGASVNDMWQFFNPTKRKWEFLKIHKEKIISNESSIILRNGWSVRKIRKNSIPFLYLAKDNKLVQTNISETEKKISEFTLNFVELSASVEKDFLKINLNDVHFPTKEYREIMNLKGALNLDGKLYLPVPSLDDLRQILIDAKIDVVVVDDDEKSIDTKTDERIQSKISELLKLLYSKYLKKESSIEDLQIALLTRSLDSIQDAEVRKELEFITKDQMNNTERIFYNFLSEKVVTYFNWQLLNDFSITSEIEGLILSGTPKDYLGKWSTNYFKIILPNFESIAHLQTQISPSFKGTGEINPLQARLSKVLIKKWRYYPYLGKLKNTGNRDEILFDHADIPFIDSSFRTIIGVPTIEKILRDMCFLDSFSLDLEEWHGSYNLSRYFLALVKIIKPLEESAKIPCMVVEDFFGNQFRIAWEFKTYLHYANEIHNISKGGYISIVVKNNLDNAQQERAGVDFATLFGVSFRFVNRQEFITKNILALIKYVGYTDIEILQQMVRNLAMINLDEILQNLVKSQKIQIRGNSCYYCYNALNGKQLSSLLDLMENPDSLPSQDTFREKWYVMWSLIRESLPTVHPLSYSINIKTEDSIPNITKMDLILQFTKKTKQFHQTQISERAQKRTTHLLHVQKTGREFQETLVGEKEEINYINHARHMFMQYGQACIKARGRRIPKAHYIAKYLARQFSYVEPQIRRQDNIIRNPSGRPIKEVEFFLEAYKLGE